MERTNYFILLLISENIIPKRLPSSWTGLDIEHRVPKYEWNLEIFLDVAIQIRPNPKWHRETLSETQKNTLNVSKKLKRIVVITTCCRHKATKHNKNGNHVVKCKKMYCKLTWCGLGGNNCSYYDQLLNILISKGYHPHELALIFTPVAQILMKSYRICKRGHTNPPKLQMSSWKFVRMAEKQNAYIKNPKIWASKRAKVVAH